MRRDGTSSGAGEGDVFGRVEKPSARTTTTITAESAVRYISSALRMPELVPSARRLHGLLARSFRAAALRRPKQPKQLACWGILKRPRRARRGRGAHPRRRVVASTTVPLVPFVPFSLARAVWLLTLREKAV